MDNLRIKCEDVMLGKLNIRNLIGNYDDVQDLYKNTSDLSIEFKPVYLIEFLTKFIDDDLNNDEVKEWSLFVLMSGCYDLPIGQEDLFDDIWTILAEISSPEIDGVLTKDKAIQYISEIQKM